MSEIKRLTNYKVGDKVYIDDLTHTLKYYSLKQQLKKKLIGTEQIIKEINECSHSLQYYFMFKDISVLCFLEKDFVDTENKQLNNKENKQSNIKLLYNF